VADLRLAAAGLAEEFSDGACGGKVRQTQKREKS
jgi:hypothetical protein